MNTTSSCNRYISPHPGLILKGELEEYGISQRELATALGKSAPMINGILAGNKDITVEIAVLLESALPGSMTANEWLRLQNEHDIELKRSESEVQDRTNAIEIWNCLRKNANFNALRRRLDFGSDLQANMSLVMNTLGIRTLPELKKKLASAGSGFKKSDKVQTDPANLFTWTVLVKHASQAQELKTGFSITNLPELKDRLNEVFLKNQMVVERTRELLNSYGIKFVTDEKRLDKVPVDGYSFWIGENPTIVATQRMNRIDNFAFTIMHEIGHIERHLKRDAVEEFLDVDRTIMHIGKEEDEANEYATDALLQGITPETLFSGILNPYAAARYLKAIAAKRKINVGIVTGQYQFFCGQRGLVRNSYALCRELIQKIG